MNIAVCIASCRPEAFKVWYNKWKDLFKKHDVDVFCAWDSDEKPPKAENTVFITRKHFPDSVPTGTSACRSAAVKEAYNIGFDMYIFLDDDVWPPEGCIDPINSYISGFSITRENPGYYDVGNKFLNPPEYTRGFPYKERHTTPIVAQYGGWDKTPDLDARDTLKHSDDIEEGYVFKRDFKLVPKYMGFTGCFMNCAFKHEVVPALFHLHQGTNRCGYDRFDDIWASLMLKRICDHFNWSIAINGLATCHHDRLSNPTKSVFQEQHGHTFNEDLWENLQRVKLYKDLNFIGCYETLISKLPESQQGYARRWILEI